MDIKRLSKGKIEEGVVRDNTEHNRIKAQPIFLKTLPTFLQSRAGAFVFVFVLSVFIFQIIPLSFFDIKNAEAQSTNQTNTSQVTGSQSGLTYSQAFRKELDDLITKSGKPSFSIYTSTDTSLQGQFQINQNSWTSSLDFSGVSNWNDFSWNRRAGTLVTPQFMVLATHHQLEIGATVSFTDRQGKIEKRKITDIRYIGGGSDIEVAKLDSPLPEDRFKVYPIFDYQEFMKNVAINDEFSNFNFEPYLNTQTTFSTPNTPVYIALNQFRSVLLQYMYQPVTLSAGENLILPTISGLDGTAFNNTPTNYLNPNAKGVITGDSGSPSFLFFNGQLVLLKTHTSPGVGPFYSYYKNDIETAIANMGGADKLRIIHLTGYRPDNREPYFDQTIKGKRVSIDEHSPAGTRLFKVSAYDLDQGQSIVYSIVGGTGKDIFKIDQNTGEITVAKSLALDYETAKELNLEIAATDNGTPVKKTYLTEARNQKSSIKVTLNNIDESKLTISGIKDISINSMDTVNVRGGTPFHINYSVQNWDFGKKVNVYIARFNSQGVKIQAMLIASFEVSDINESDTLEINIPDDVLKANNAAIGEGDYYKLLFVDQKGSTGNELETIYKNSNLTQGVFAFTNLFSVRYKNGSKLGAFNPVQPAFNNGTNVATSTVQTLIPGPINTVQDLSVNDDGYDKTLCGISFSKNLSQGATGIDVYNLQKFLISKGPLQQVSGVPSYYFGNLTKNALVSYQSSKNISPAAGYFGPLTRTQINSSIQADCAEHGDVAIQNELPNNATSSTPDALTLARKITISYPVGGEVFEHGKAYRIGWTGQNLPNGTLVNIYKVTITGETKIAENINSYSGYSNSYYWTPTAADKGIMKIKVVSQSDVNLYGISQSNFTVTAPQDKNVNTTISINSPATGETWIKDEARTFTWTAGNLSEWGQGGKIEIVGNDRTYTVTRNALLGATISGNTAQLRYANVGTTEKTNSEDERISAGEYNVRICSPFGACGMTGKINISEKTTDYSTQDPWVMVAAMSDVTVGQTKRITWETNDKVKNVTISLLSADKRSFGTFLAQNIPNTEYFDWVVADQNTSQTDFVISVRGGNNLNSAEASFTDYSDNTFKINGRTTPTNTSTPAPTTTATTQSNTQSETQVTPSVKVLAPSTNDTLVEGQKYTIRYEALHADNVDIRLAGPTGVQDLVYAVPNTGTYEWTVSRMGNSPSAGQAYAIAVRGRNTYGTSYAAGGTFSITSPQTATTTATVLKSTMSNAAYIQWAIQKALEEYYRLIKK